MNNRYTKPVVVLTAVVAIVAVGIQSVRNDFGLGRNMEVIANMMRALYTSYVDEINPDDMLRSGATGITAKLDPYTVFLAASDKCERQNQNENQYENRSDAEFFHNCLLIILPSIANATIRTHMRSMDTFVFIIIL